MGDKEILGAIDGSEDDSTGTELKIALQSQKASIDALYQKIVSLETQLQLVSQSKEDITSKFKSKMRELASMNESHNLKHRQTENNFKIEIVLYYSNLQESLKEEKTNLSEKLKEITRQKNQKISVLETEIMRYKKYLLPKSNCIGLWSRM